MTSEKVWRVSVILDTGDDLIAEDGVYLNTAGTTANSIMKSGFMLRDGDTRRYYPVHRIQLVTVERVPARDE